MELIFRSEKQHLYNTKVVLKIAALILLFFVFIFFHQANREPEYDHREEVN